jgi:hypothetical protein
MHNVEGDITPTGFAKILRRWHPGGACFEPSRKPWQNLDRSIEDSGLDSEKLCSASSLHCHDEGGCHGRVSVVPSFGQPKREN